VDVKAGSDGGGHASTNARPMANGECGGERRMAKCGANRAITRAHMHTHALAVEWVGQRFMVTLMLMQIHIHIHCL